MNDEQRPPEDLESTVSFDLSGQGPQETISRYRLLQKVGEGGMGEVWLADQQEPVRRRVAVKIIKRGMDTKQVVARFEAERQALAIMDHPCIARVFDAGESVDGRPFFVMEYVKGVPITEHCDRQLLTTRERLELFAQVCEGVQHAHQKAIIHRDLKPSNVLVTIQDGKPVPKIIDFGVAKAIEHRLTERTLFTELGQIIGTPEYMSPEQAEMTTQDIDTRTDVYSLGVMLYELLVGALPFDSKELRRAGFDEIRRRIREDEPSRPSARITALDEATTGSAKKRRTDPVSLARQLRGDLDWITMKALEKDRTRRYSTPSEMATDIGRHLRDEAVSASPPGGVYRLRKFVKRHKIAVVVGSLLGLATWIGLAGLAHGFAERSFVDASRRVKNLRIYAHNFWLYDNSKNDDFLVALFDSSRFNKPEGSITAIEIIDQAVRELPPDIDLRAGSNALIYSHRLTLLGRLYMNLGVYGAAEPLLHNALEIRSAHMVGSRSLILESFENCADFYRRSGQETRAQEYLARAESYRNEHSRSTWQSVNTIDWTDPRLDGVKRELLKLDGRYGEAYEWPLER